MLLDIALFYPTLRRDGIGQDLTLRNPAAGPDNIQYSGVA